MKVVTPLSDERFREKAREWVSTHGLEEKYLHSLYIAFKEVSRDPTRLRGNAGNRRSKEYLRCFSRGARRPCKRMYECGGKAMSAYYFVSRSSVTLEGEVVGTGYTENEVPWAFRSRPLPIGSSLQIGKGKSKVVFKGPIYFTKISDAQKWVEEHLKLQVRSGVIVGER